MNKELLQLARDLVALLESIMLHHPDYADEADWQILQEAHRIIEEAEE